VAFDLVLRQPQGPVLGDDQRVQSHSASRHREVAEGCEPVGVREVLPCVEPIAAHDQAHRRLVGADQRPRQLTRHLERRVDADLELGLRTIDAHGRQRSLECVTS
jgi:hypothetical protein